MKSRITAVVLCLAGALCTSIGAAEPNTISHARVVAGPAGRTVSLGGGIELQLRPGATIRSLPKTTPFVRGGAVTQLTPVVVKTGTVHVHVPAGAHKRGVIIFDKLGKGGIVLAGAGIFTTAGKSVVVANVRGKVLAGRGSRWKPVSAGTKQRIDHRGYAGDPTPLVGAPVVRPTSRVVVAVGAGAKVGGLRWGAAVGASSYEIALRQRGHVQQTRYSETTSIADTFDAIAPGRYDVVVRAFDEHGINSPWAKLHSVRAVGVQLPAGAAVDPSGTIRLGPTQKIRLTHADGMLLKRTGMSRWLKSSQKVGLHEDRRTVVYLREKDSLDISSVPLEPRGMRADVFAGPKTAVWPRDPVKITVRLIDKNGRPAATSAKATPKVMLGTTRVKVKFERNGNVLEGTVPPRRGRGPWVLRVEVEDELGLPIGRDFVEIVRQPYKRPPLKRVARRER